MMVVTALRRRPLPKLATAALLDRCPATFTPPTAATIGPAHGRGRPGQRGGGCTVSSKEFPI
jgi:hypothetical protein